MSILFYILQYLLTIKLFFIMKSGIYKIENVVTGKSYIGRSLNCQNRWRQHLYKLRKNKHPNPYLQNSWNKHGENNFEFSIIEFCEESILENKECYWIQEYNALDAAWGYNIADPTVNGGYSEEYKQKLRDSAVQTQIRLKKEGYYKQRVYDLINGTYKEYPSTSDIPKELGLSKRKKNFITKHCRILMRNSTEEQRQQYLKDMQDEYQSYISSISEYSNRTVYKFDKNTGELVGTYQGRQEAAKLNNIKPQQVTDSISGISASIKGFIYKYNKDFKLPKRTRYSRIDFNGTIYSGWKECSKATGLTKSQIITRCRSKNHNVFWIPASPKPKKIKIPSKKIIDQNGVIYESVNKAAELLNLKTKKMYEVLAGRNKTTKGYSFQYVQ